MKKHYFLFFCFILTASCIVGEENKIPALTLQQCLDIAQKQSYELKVQSERRFQAEQRLKQSTGDILPDIRFKYSKFYRDTVNGEYDGEGANSRFTLNQPLFYGFRKANTVTLSKADIRKEEFLYQNVSRILRLDVTQSFYSIIQIETDITNIQNTLKFMQDRLSELNERARLGKSRESEILAMESQIANLNAQYEKIKGDQSEANETLSRLLGIASADINLIDDTPSVEKAGLVENYIEAVKSRPDIESVRQDVIIQSEEVKIVKGALLPTVNLDGSYYTSRTGSMSDDGKWDALLTLDMPLFQGGILRGKINEEVARQRELENNLSLLLRDATAEVLNLHKSLVSSLNQAIAYKEAYDKAEKSYQLQLGDYKLGLVNNLDVIQALLTMSDIKRNMDKTLIQVKIDKAMLDIAVMK
ncbi:MAG: TolC family protein [Elusimicrobia bacterium]|nr:TolC family protein [Elusimicrobiota bacterium]